MASEDNCLEDFEEDFGEEGFDIGSGTDFVPPLLFAPSFTGGLAFAVTLAAVFAEVFSVAFLAAEDFTAEDFADAGATFLLAAALPGVLLEWPGVAAFFGVAALAPAALAGAMAALALVFCAGFAGAVFELAAVFAMVVFCFFAAAGIIDLLLARGGDNDFYEAIERAKSSANPSKTRRLIFDNALQKACSLYPIFGAEAMQGGST